MKAAAFILLLGAASLSAEVRVGDTLVLDGYSISTPKRPDMRSDKSSTVPPSPVLSKFLLPAEIKFQEGTLEFRVPSSLLDRETIGRQLPDVRFPTCG